MFLNQLTVSFKFVDVWFGVMRPTSSFSHYPGREDDNDYRLSHSTETRRGNRWTRGESGYRSSCGSCRDCLAIPLHCDREMESLWARNKSLDDESTTPCLLTLPPSSSLWPDSSTDCATFALALFFSFSCFMCKNAFVLVSLLCSQENWCLYSWKKYSPQQQLTENFSSCSVLMRRFLESLQALHLQLCNRWTAVALTRSAFWWQLWAPLSSQLFANAAI